MWTKNKCLIKQMKFNVEWDWHDEIIRKSNEAKNNKIWHQSLTL